MGSFMRLLGEFKAIAEAFQDGNTPARFTSREGIDNLRTIEAVQARIELLRLIVLTCLFIQISVSSGNGAADFFITLVMLASLCNSVLISWSVNRVKIKVFRAIERLL